MKKLMTAVALAAITSASQAAEINGISVADTLPGSANQSELRLVDLASQNYYYLDNAYVGAVYQSEQASAPERVEFIVTSDRISGRALGVSLYETMALQLEWDQYEALEPQMSSMVKMLDTKLEKGDRVVVTYSASKGAEVFVKGEYKGTLQGENLFALTAASWLKQDTQLDAVSGIAQTSSQQQDSLPL